MQLESEKIFEEEWKYFISSQIPLTTAKDLCKRFFLIGYYKNKPKHSVGQ
jgi:hypothetical protein